MSALERADSCCVDYGCRVEIEEDLDLGIITMKVTLPDSTEGE